MANNPEIVEWIATAPGLALNPDRAYGNQCVDAVDAYAQAIFNVPWPVCVGGVQGAKQLLDRAPDEFWIRTDNDPGNPALIPSNGDVVVFGGNAANEWGHTAIVDSADQNGMWVIQQDGFAEPRIFVDGGWYSNKPAHRAWLPYWGPGTGMIAGWLTPRPEKIINYVPPASHAPLLPNQRLTVPDAQVGYRKAPRADADLISWFEPDHVYDFKGYVRASDGSIWFVGAYTGGFSKATGFTDEGTHDLPDLTDLLLPPVPVIVPPVQPVDVRLTTEPHLNMIDVSNYQASADLAGLQADIVGIKASEGVGWTDPALADNVAEARRGGAVVLFYHYARFGAQTGNTAAAEAASFLDAIKPHVRPGDLVALDNEAEGRLDVASSREWLDVVRKATGATGFFYANHDQIVGVDNGDGWHPVEGDYPLWFAGGSIYGVQTEGFRPREAADALVGWASGFRIWQYTSRGRLPGYSGDLDLNVYYGTRDSLALYAVKAVLPEPEPPANKVPPGLDDTIRDLVAFYQA